MICFFKIQFPVIQLHHGARYAPEASGELMVPDTNTDLAHFGEEQYLNLVAKMASEWDRYQTIRYRKPHLKWLEMHEKLESSAPRPPSYQSIPWPDFECYAISKNHLKSSRLEKMVRSTPISLHHSPQVGPDKLAEEERKQRFINALMLEYQIHKFAHNGASRRRLNFYRWPPLSTLALRPRPPSCSIQFDSSTL